MISEEQKKANDEFESLVRGINIDGANIDALVDMLWNKGFFNAPASTQYNLSYDGGLVTHCLNVYDALKNLVDTYCPNKYDDNSIRIVGLLHCVYKADFYEKYFKNEKVYSTYGKKSDEGGKYDWVAKECYKVKDDDKRFICADNATNSYLMLSKYIPMTKDEISAIINQDNGMTMNSRPNNELPSIYSRYSLATLLHCAIMIATYVMEK